MLLPAQTQAVRTISAFGAGIVVPAFLAPAPPQTDPVAYWTAYLRLNSAQQASLKTILSDQQNSLDSMKANLSQAHSTLRAAAHTADQKQKLDNLTASSAGGVAGALTVVSSGEASGASANQ